jgi:hypothetical protein
MADRSVQQLRSDIAAGWRQHEAAGRGKRYDTWTDDDRRRYELKIVFEGMSYGFNGLRLSQAAEGMLRSEDSLDVLADNVLARLHAAERPVTTGWVADELNAIARERHDNAA